MAQLTALLASSSSSVVVSFLRIFCCAYVALAVCEVSFAALSFFFQALKPQLTIAVSKNIACSERSMYVYMCRRTRV